MHKKNRSGMSRRGVKLASVCAVVLSSSLVLQGCSSSGGEDGSGGTTLTFMSNSRGQEAILTKLAAQYSEDHDVTVRIDTPGPTDFPTKLQAAAQSNDMPDIYSAIGLNVMAPFYKAGWAMDLSEEFKGEWGDSLSPSILEITTFDEGNALGVDPGIYSAHWNIVTYGLYVNPETSGLQPGSEPETIPELITALQDAPGGPGQFSVAASVAPQLLLGYASNYMTDDEINATIAGKASWNTDEWRKTFQVFTDLSEGGVLANGTIPGGGDDAANVEKSFFNSKAVGVMFDSGAAIGVGRATAADFTDYFTMSLPAAADGTQEPRTFTASGGGAAVNPRGEHPEEALAFVKWLTEPEQQLAISKAAGTVPTSVAVDKSKLDKQIAGMADSLKNSEVISNAVTPDVNAAIGAGAQSLVLGEKSVDDVLAEVQAAQDASTP